MLPAETATQEANTKEAVSSSTPSKEQPQTIAKETAVSTANSQESASAVSSDSSSD